MQPIEPLNECVCGNAEKSQMVLLKLIDHLLADDKQRPQSSLANAHTKKVKFKIDPWCKMRHTLSVAPFVAEGCRCPV